MLAHRHICERYHVIRVQETRDRAEAVLRSPVRVDPAPQQADILLDTQHEIPEHFLGLVLDRRDEFLSRAKRRPSCGVRIKITVRGKVDIKRESSGAQHEG